MAPLVGNPPSIYFCQAAVATVEGAGPDTVLVSDGPRGHEAGCLAGQGADSGIQGLTPTNFLLTSCLFRTSLHSGSQFPRRAHCLGTRHLFSSLLPRT